jgi:hypothetical protein
LFAENPDFYADAGISGNLPAQESCYFVEPLGKGAGPMTDTRSLAMIATSTVVVFVLMYLNTDLFGHVSFSETRIWMAVLMGATMAFVTMSFMRTMSPAEAANAATSEGATSSAAALPQTRCVPNSTRPMT